MHVKHWRYRNLVKKIPGYECKYSATKDGRIWSDYKKGFLKPKIDKKGYEVVVLYKKGKPKSFLVHRLIATTFLENPDNLPTVNHDDGDPLNNSLDNLEWMSFSDNHRHAYRTGLRKPAAYLYETDKRIFGKLSEGDVREIRRLLQKGLHPYEISEKYEVVPGTIYNIKANRSWSHVD